MWTPIALPAEKERGITIDLGFAALTLGEFRLAIIDVPGHERFVRNMLAGATGLDLAMLIVAADDSVMPQTREHLEILRLLGLSGGLVVLTKCDLADPILDRARRGGCPRLDSRDVSRRCLDRANLGRQRSGTRATSNTSCICFAARSNRARIPACFGWRSTVRLPWPVTGRS